MDSIVFDTVEGSTATEAPAFSLSVEEVSSFGDGRDVPLFNPEAVVMHSDEYNNTVSAARDALQGSYNGMSADLLAHTVAQAFTTGADLAKFASCLAAVSRVHAKRTKHIYVPPEQRVKEKKTVNYTPLTADVAKTIPVLAAYSISKIENRVIVSVSGPLQFELDGISNPLLGSNGSYPPVNKDNFAKEVFNDFIKNAKWVSAVGAVSNPFYNIYAQLANYTKENVSRITYKSFEASAATMTAKTVEAIDSAATNICGALSLPIDYKLSVLVGDFQSLKSTLESCRAARGEDNAPSLVMPWYYLNAPRGLNSVLCYRSFLYATKTRVHSPYIPDLAPPIESPEREALDLNGRLAKTPGVSTVIATLVSAGALVKDGSTYKAGSGHAFMMYPLVKDDKEQFETLAKLIATEVLYWAPFYTPHNSTIIVATFRTGFTIRDLFFHLRFCKALNLVRTVCALNPFAAGKITSDAAAQVWRLNKLKYLESPIGAVKEKYLAADLDFNIEEAPIEHVEKKAKVSASMAEEKTMDVDGYVPLKE